MAGERCHPFVRHLSLSVADRGKVGDVKHETRGTSKHEILMAGRRASCQSIINNIIDNKNEQQQQQQQQHQ